VGWLAAVVIAGGVLGPLALRRACAVPARGRDAAQRGGVLYARIRRDVPRRRLGRLGWRARSGSAGRCSRYPSPSPRAGASGLGVALVIAACALWGLDNNLTHRLSLRDARVTAAVKGLAGGAALLAMAAVLGDVRGFTPGRIAGIAVSGALAWGLSLVLFIRGLRALGVLQTGTLFALAPGFAAVLSFALLGERPGPMGVPALVLMTGGALLLSRDRHAHFHVHEAVEHAHPHAHDAHHPHAHTRITIPALTRGQKWGQFQILDLPRSEVGSKTRTDPKF
jgi:uncharacterized membrane protein